MTHGAFSLGPILPIKPMTTAIVGFGLDSVKRLPVRPDAIRVAHAWPAMSVFAISWGAIGAIAEGTPSPQQDYAIHVSGAAGTTKSTSSCVPERSSSLSR